MGKAQLRPGKASKGKAQEEEDDFDNSQSDSLLAGLLADQTSLLALFVLVAVIVIIGLMLWVNHSASIQSYVANTVCKRSFLSTAHSTCRRRTPMTRTISSSPTPLLTRSSVQSSMGTLRGQD